MAEQFQLRIVTPACPVLDEPVQAVTGPGTIGEFGVLPNHAAYLTSLETGRLTYHGARGVQHLAVRGGFAEVVDNVMTVLADAAVPSGEIDRVSAEADLAAAETRLRGLSPDDSDYAAATSDLRWAQARLDVARAK